MRLLEGRYGIIAHAHKSSTGKKHVKPLNRGHLKSFFTKSDRNLYRKARPAMWARLFSQITGDTNTHISTLQQEQSMQTTPNTPSHLLILVHGLFGSRYNWEYISEVLQEHLDTTTTLIHVSKANERAATFAGIDACGSALAAEIKNIVSVTPSLQRISFIGHSMGGLISRYAAGELYDSENNSIASLKPSHFITMATPHLGCEPEIESPAQVPLVSWLQLPFGLDNLVNTISPKISSALYRRSGGQFFLTDSDDGQPPLLYRLSQDCPLENRYYWSALASFETRTAYANSSGDYFVGWANSSLRDIHELPTFLPGTKGRGVVREDPMEMAWSLESRPEVEEFGDALGLDPVHGHVATSVKDIMDASTAQDLLSKEEEMIKNDEKISIESLPTRAINNLKFSSSLSNISSRTSTRNVNSTIDSSSTGRVVVAEPAVHVAEPGGNRKTKATAAYVKASLVALQQLQWRRIDCCFAGAAIPLLAHQHMQVQRKWMNYDGMATAKHLALQLAAMEEILKKRDGAAVAGARAAPSDAARKNEQVIK
jgi:pimeloyl-ACP methyl ester carboxylesterase